MSKKDSQKRTTAETKAQIVDGTLRALQKSGLPPLSYDAIAAEAGLSRQLVRYHFPDSEALMLGACEALAGAYRDSLVANAARIEEPHRLGMFLDFYFDLLDGAQKPRDDRAYDAMMSLAAGSEAVRANLRGQYTLLGQVISHEIQLAHPQLAAKVADELSYLFVCLMYGHWKMVASLGVSEAHNRVSRRAMEQLIRSYVASGAPAEDVGGIWSIQA